MCIQYNVLSHMMFIIAYQREVLYIVYICIKFNYIELNLIEYIIYWNLWLLLLYTILYTNVITIIIIV